MIVWIASYPRSGNTYYRMILYHLCGIETFSIYDDPTLGRIGASGVVGHELLPSSIEDLTRDERIYFVKTHELPSDSNPAIYLIRDGRDALVSYARYTHSFGKKSGKIARLKYLIGLDSFNQTLQDLIISQRWGGWSNHVLGWTFRRRDGATSAIRYEDLVIDPITWLKKSLEDLQIQSQPDGGRPPDFDDLHHKWPQFFRKGKIGSWQEEMTEDLHEFFWKHHAQGMEAFGYGRA